MRPASVEKAAPPPAWERVIGQETVVRRLRHAVETGLLSHAYLLWGPAGTGKATVAAVASAAALCEDEKESAGRPCGGCRSCRAASRLEHPDLLWIKAEGAAIGIGQVRRLQRQVALRPYWRRRRIVVLEGAERLTEAAQNGLLKTLEEPPPGAVILLLAASAGALLPTLRSRCESLRFAPVAAEAIEKALVDGGMPEKEAAALARASGGRPGLALAADAESWRARRNEVAQWSRRLATDPNGWHSIGQALESAKEEADEWLSLWALWLRDLLLCRMNLSERIVNLDCGPQLEEESRAYTVQGLAEALQACQECAGLLLGPVNFRLTVDSMLIRVKRGLAA